MPPFSIIGFVRDEEDVIEAFVRHHAPVTAAFRFALHRCTDGTRDILERLAAEGLPVSVREVQDEAYVQAETLTAMLREAAADAPWVLPLDADEFLAVDGALGARLSDVPSDRPSLLPWRTYVPMPEDVSGMDLPQRIRHRRAAERPQYWKVLLPAGIAAQPGVSLSLGSHALLRADGTPWRAERAPGLRLAHFPVRGEAQLRRKVLDGWRSQQLRPDHRPGQVFQWEALHARCLDPRPIAPEELRDIAARYASQTEETPALIDDALLTPVPSPRTGYDPGTQSAGRSAGEAHRRA